MASLLLVTGTRQGQRLALQGEALTLGRDGGCDIVIDESMVSRVAAGRPDSISRRHAIITYVGGTYYIEDGDGQGNASRNGTFVNERKVAPRKPTALRDGDRVRICDFVCVFQEDAELPYSVGAMIDQESSSDSLQSQPVERLRVILEISNALSTTLDLETILPRLIEGLFRLFKQADRAFVILREPPNGPLEVRAFRTRRPAEAADARFSASIVRRCLETRKAILGNDLAHQFPDSESVNILPVRSLVCAPMWSPDGPLIGALQVDGEEERTVFSEDDLHLLLGVASQASIALSNARLHRAALAHQQHQRNMELAHQVQLALLPRRLPEVPGYQFFAHYEPAQQIGGDYYDFLPLAGNRLAVLLGDVEGKGVAAALVMAKFSVEARVCLESAPDAPAAVTRLNSLMARVDAPGRFVTLVAAVLDLETHTATLVNAGHPSPLLALAAGGDVVEATTLEGGGLPLGVDDRQTYSGCQVRLQPGDSLMLFSDGVPDALNSAGRPLGTGAIRIALEHGRLPPAEAGAKLVRAVKQHAAGCVQNDDITVVCFGRVG